MQSLPPCTKSPAFYFPLKLPSSSSSFLSLEPWLLSSIAQTSFPRSPALALPLSPSLFPTTLFRLPLYEQKRIAQSKNLENVHLFYSSKAQGSRLTAARRYARACPHMRTAIYKKSGKCIKSMHLIFSPGDELRRGRIYVGNLSAVENIPQCTNTLHELMLQNCMS